MGEREDFLMKAVKHRTMLERYSPPDKIERYMMGWLTGPANKIEVASLFKSLDEAMREIMEYEP